MNHIDKFTLKIPLVSCAAVMFVFSLFLTGCRTHDSNDDSAQIIDSVKKENPKALSKPSQPLTLHEGDTVRISFIGAPTLNTVQQIRRDGRITLQLIGEINPVGLTPTELEEEISRLIGPQLVSKEVMVTVDSAFPVFVTGSVTAPGKIMTDRPITALQSIMQAGGPSYGRANLKAVRVIREEDGRIRNYRINLKRVLQGEKSDPFNLKPGDIVYVPAKFSWF